MTHEELKRFISEQMRMSHIYQPLLIKSLVEAGGTATIRQLAGEFLIKDESQLLYYEKRLKEMPIKVLSKHQILIRDKEMVTLNIGKLTLEQRAELIMLCEQKIQEFIVSRGIAVWDYRMLEDDAISDPLRYRVLKESGGRCSLCGCTKEERILDVDHILPRSKGGKNVYENLQVLCSKCNRSKGNKDKTDFRSYGKEEAIENCLFCTVQSQKEKIILRNELCFLIEDAFPVTKGHALVIPKRHVADYFLLSIAEQQAANELLQIRRKQLLAQDKTIDGFNMGVNSGEAAGQTIFHCHIHLIPRRRGDVDNPKGGVRGVIPKKQRY